MGLTLHAIGEGQARDRWNVCNVNMLLLRSITLLFSVLFIITSVEFSEAFLLDDNEDGSEDYDYVDIPDESTEKHMRHLLFDGEIFLSPE